MVPVVETTANLTSNRFIASVSSANRVRCSLSDDVVITLAHRDCSGCGIQGGHVGIFCLFLVREKFINTILLNYFLWWIFLILEFCCMCSNEGVHMPDRLVEVANAILV